MQQVVEGYEIIIYTGIHEVEMWKPVPIDGFDKLYEVSNLGRIRRAKTGNLRTVVVSSDGYCQFGLSMNGIRTSKRVHVFVGKCFVPNPHNRNSINHKDGNKANPHWKNLEWCTQQENIIHAVETGLMNTAKGERQWLSKFKENDIIEIRNKHKNGIPVTDLANAYNVTYNAIRGIIIGRTWKHIKAA